MTTEKKWGGKFMAKKKDKPRIVNNIQELNLEIDYDKLAEAIVKAQENSEEETNKSKKHTSSVFALIVITMLQIASFLVGLISVALFLRSICTAIDNTWYGWANILRDILKIAFELLWVALFGMYSVLLWKSAKEIETEKDRHYIISVFSGIVSFAALIVALVALFKGVR